MRIYDRHILPHLIDFACGMGAVMKVRLQIVPLAHGRVLAIGSGSRGWSGSIRPPTCSAWPANAPH